MQKTDLTGEELSNNPAEVDQSSKESKPVKKVFIEPRISVPVDILEVTTFQQVADSGINNN